MAGTTPIEIPLDGSVQSKPHPLLREPAGLSIAINARHLTGPRGTVERMPGPAETTTVSDADAIGIVGAGGDVLVADVANGFQAHRRRLGTVEQRDSDAGGSLPAQRVIPCAVVDGGVLFAGGPDDVIVGAHTVIRNGYLVGIWTVRREKPAGRLAAPRDTRYFTTVTVRDAETGERVISDEIVQDFSTAGLAVRKSLSLGAIPVLVDSERKVAVWWAEENAGRTGWVVKTSLVNVESDAVLAIGAALSVYSTTKLTHGIAVTGDISNPGTSRYTYCVRSRNSDDRAELFVWDHYLGTGTATAAANATATVYTGLLYEFSSLDISVAGDEACVLFAGANGGAAASVCHAIKWTDPTGTPTEAWHHPTALPQTHLTAVSYTAVSVTAQLRSNKAAWDWLFAGQQEDLIAPGQFPNITPTNYTKQVRIQQAWVYTPGTLTLSSAGLYHYGIAVRGFSPHPGNGKGSYGQFGLSKLPREHDTVDSMQGSGDFVITASDARAQADPAIELAAWHALNSSVNLHGFCPSARIGVDRATNPRRAWQFLRAGQITTKPQSDDGHTFAIAYPADPVTLGGVASNVRWAKVDYEAAPVSLEARDRTTYVASGNLHAWDGETLHECTPLAFPRLRIDAAHVVSGGTVMPAGTYQLNAIYRTRDANGVVHRSQPYPVDYVWTSPGAVTAAVYVEIPLSARDGVAASFAGVEVYCSRNNGTTMYLVGDVRGDGVPATPIAETGGEFKVELSYDRVNENATPAYWQADELIHTAPPAMLDLAQVGDIVIGLTGEERLFRFTKPRQAGSDAQLALEWPSQNEIPIPAKGTAVTELAERPLLFSADDAWTVYGVGPDKLGAGDFSPPTRVANIGTVDHKLVARIPAGVVFKSKRGWWLMGKDYSLTPFGADLENALVSVTRIVALPEFSELRLSVGGGTGVFVYNWDSGAWSYTLDSGTDEAVTQGRLFSLSRNNGAYTVDHDYTDYAGREVMLETNWIQPAGVEGDVHAETFSITAERVAAHDLRVTVWTDYDQSGSAGTIYDFTDAQLVNVSADDIYTVQESLEFPSARAFKFRIEERNADQTAAATFRPIKLTLHVRKISAKAERYQRKA